MLPLKPRATQQALRPKRLAKRRVLRPKRLAKRRVLGLRLRAKPLRSNSFASRSGEACL